MTCRRCAGLMVLGSWIEDGRRAAFQRCPACGNIEDPVIEHNRRHPSRAGRQLRHQTFDPEAVWSRVLFKLKQS